MEGLTRIYGLFVFTIVLDDQWITYTNETYAPKDKKFDPLSYHK